MEKVINKKNDPKRKVRIKLKKITKQIRWKTKKWVKNENIINKRKNAINKKFSLWKNKINFSIESRILMQDLYIYIFFRILRALSGNVHYNINPSYVAKTIFI